VDFSRDLSTPLDDSFYKAGLNKEKADQKHVSPIKEEVIEEDMTDTFKDNIEEKALSVSEHYTSDSFEEAQDMDKTFPVEDLKKETEHIKLKEMNLKLMNAQALLESKGHDDSMNQETRKDIMNEFPDDSQDLGKIDVVKK